MSCWEEIPGKRVSALERGPERFRDLVLTADGTSYKIRADYIECTVGLYPIDVDPEEIEWLELGALVGKRIFRLDVPFIAPGYRDDAKVLVTTEDGLNLYIAAEDFRCPLRIEKI